MIKISKEKTKRLLAVHGWSGVVLGLALYVVVLTGAIVVFSHEIGVWSASGSKLQEPLNQELDATLRGLSETIPKEYLEEVGIFHNSSGNIVAFFHTHTKNEQGQLTDKGVRFEIDPVTHQIISQHEGLQEDFPVDPVGALDEFLVELHVNLHAPHPWGLYLTGILGLVLLVSSISGFILHRHLFRDIFLSPRISNPLLNTRDRHNLAGTWGLPFSVILAFTGAFFSFALSIGLPVIAMTAFGGDQEKVIETILGVPEQEDKTPTTLANIDDVLVESTERVGSIPQFISIQHWGRADAKMFVFHPPAEGKLTGAQYEFNGVTGELIGLKPQLGTQPSAGSTVISLMSVLHFGTFAGTLSRIIWLSLGLAICYVTITGIDLWLRRREEIPAWNRLMRVVPMIGYGLPIAMVGAAIGFFWTLPTATSAYWTPASFLIFSALSIALSLLTRNQTLLVRVYRGVLGLLMLLLPVLRIYVSGAGWSDLLSSENQMVIAMDISMFVGGIIFLVLARRKSSRIRVEKSDFVDMETAGLVK